jgi:hypothetical protein
MSKEVGQTGLGLYPIFCKKTPEVSPVNRSSWDNDTNTPWVCEHRWDGVAGMVRFRRAIANYTEDHVVPRLKDKTGHLGYSIGEVAFVALSRGYNWFTKHGPNSTLDLAKYNDTKTWNRKTGMPKGEYCNLAAISYPSDMPLCGGVDNPWHRIAVNENGTIVSGHLPSGRVVAIHVAFKAPPRQVEGKSDKRAIQMATSGGDETVHSNAQAMTINEVAEISV